MPLRADAAARGQKFLQSVRGIGFPGQAHLRSQRARQGASASDQPHSAQAPVLDDGAGQQEVQCGGCGAEGPWLGSSCGASGSHDGFAVVAPGAAKLEAALSFFAPPTMPVPAAAPLPPCWRQGGEKTREPAEEERADGVDWTRNCTLDVARRRQDVFAAVAPRQVDASTDSPRSRPTPSGDDSPGAAEAWEGFWWWIREDGSDEQAPQPAVDAVTTVDAAKRSPAPSPEEDEAIESLLGELVWSRLYDSKEAEALQPELPGQGILGDDCVVCMDRKANTRFIPCFHTCVCAQCAAKLPQRNCPLCRQSIKQVLRNARLGA
jgi:hypothetical protein